MDIRTVILNWELNNNEWYHMQDLHLNCHRQMDSCRSGGDLAHWTMLRKIFSSQGIRSLESAVKSYTSWAWSSNAWKSGCFSKVTLITNLLWYSPTYTTKWPFGTSLGTIFSSCSNGHKDHVQHISQAAEGMTLRPVLRHFFIHALRNFAFIIFIFSLSCGCVYCVCTRERILHCGSDGMMEVFWEWWCLNVRKPLYKSGKEPTFWNIKWLTCVQLRGS